LQRAQRVGHPKASHRVKPAPPASPGVETGAAAIHLDALDRYRKTKVHFVDCLIAATAAAENMPVASFDRDFRKFNNVRVETG